MKNFSDDLVEKIFVTVSTTISLDEFHKETVISISKSGSVFLYSLSTNSSVYSIDSLKNEQNQESPTQTQQNSETKNTDFSMDQIAIRSKTTIKCIGTFTFLPDLRRVEIQYRDLYHIMIVSGFIYKNVPSVGVYHISKLGMVPIHIESLTGAISLAYNTLNQTIVVLPRSLNGSLIHYKFNNDRIEQFHPEYISKFVISCFGCKRATHMRMNPMNQYQIMMWNDEDKPFLSFSTLKSNEWENEIYNFTENSYIQAAEFDDLGLEIGLVIGQEKRTIIALWEFEEEKIKQTNFTIPESIIVTQARWIRDTSNETLSFCIWTANQGMIEANKTSLLLWKNDSIKANLFGLSNGHYIVYFDKNGALTFAGKSTIENDYEQTQIIGEKYKPLSFIKAKIHGKTMNANGVHMQRCFNCKRPLLYPLVSSEDGISACYCSYECQVDHWPLYFASRQPVFFDFDNDKLST